MTMPSPAGELTFPPAVLDLLDAEEEVDIETTRANGAARTTIIWVVVEAGVAYVRSVRGPDGRWYQDVLARPDATIVAAGQRIAVRALPAADAPSVEGCSIGLRTKYRADPSLQAMLAPAVLPTTLRLVPR